MRNRVTHVTTGLSGVTGVVTHVTTGLSDDINRQAKENWAKMDGEMREFVKALVDVGLMDGRQGLAKAAVAVFPDRLPPTQGVVPYVATEGELASIEAARSRGRR